MAIGRLDEIVKNTTIVYVGNYRIVYNMRDSIHVDIDDKVF